MNSFKQLCDNLESKIINAYTEGVSLDAAEKLASEFLVAQIKGSEQLKIASLDARMRKSGLKAIRAAVYLDIVQKAEKKPVEAQITAMLDSDKIVMSEQEALDVAEVEAEELKRVFDIYNNAHIHFRGISKGRMDG